MTVSRPASITTNPLRERDPELVHRLAAFCGNVNDILADQFAAHHFQRHGLTPQHRPHDLEDLKAAAIVLRMLTKPSWNQNDFAVFDAFWRQAMCFDVLADEFEAERHRIQHLVQSARSDLQLQKETLWP
ncbi:MAG TPA: hypothetical protein VE988_10260 [Gemmataceae bacterium]|nr:hypothetical protein [Gemmataceae bacterium]